MPRQIDFFHLLLRRTSTMKTVISVLLLAASFSGCAVYTPSGSVVVDPGRVSSSSGGSFCPPGQAKKGNC
jgi:hypothetical protein